MNDALAEYGPTIPPPAPRIRFWREWARWDLSERSSVKIEANGAMEPREIGRLIRLLETQKTVLEE